MIIAKDKYTGCSDAKTLCKAIKFQRYDKNPAVILRKCTRRKQVNSEFILSIYVCIWLPWNSFAWIMVLKLHSFDRRRQNVSQNIFSNKILHFLCVRIEAKYT